jgi:small subunit ribosomal protein S4e
MVRGPKKHLKRLNAPKHWMLDKLGGIFAPRPSTGPHKMRECLPLVLVLRNRLKYALTRQETMMIVMRRLVKVDHKVRTDINYPAGFMDVITMEKTGENYRLLYDVKGRFVLHRISAEEAKYKLCKVVQLSKGSKAMIGTNPFHHGQAAAIPYVVTHDGRTVRYPDPLIKPNDTIKFDIATGKIVDFIKFEVGNTAMVTAGGNAGRMGVIMSIDNHPGSFGIVHLKDKRGNAFATRLGNVFAVGEGAKPWISIPRGKGIQLSVIEQKEKLEKGTASKKKD